MFLNSKDFFSGHESLRVDQDGSPTEQDLQIAVVALLIAISKADSHLATSEIEEIFDVVTKQFHLVGEKSATLLEVASYMMNEDSDRLYEFIAAVRENFDLNQRMRVLGLIWKIILADGKLDPEENHFAVAIRKDLDLSLEQAVRAQQLAQEGEYD